MLIDPRIYATVGILFLAVFLFAPINHKNWDIKIGGAGIAVTAMVAMIDWIWS